MAGNPLQFILERTFTAAGLDWRCLTLEVKPEDLEAAVSGIRALGFLGASMETPHTTTVIPYLDRLSESAELMGVVNCLYFDEDQLVGENTDGKGFVSALRQQIDPAEKNVVVLGAGGTARSIAVELALCKASRIQIVNRSEERAENLVHLLADRLGTEAQSVTLDKSFVLPEDADIVINATTLGNLDASEMIPVDPDSFRESMVVADVIFNPPQTKFLNSASSAGCKTVDGLGMLVNRAVIAFQTWTGIDPDAEVMREALEEFLGV